VADNLDNKAIVTELLDRQESNFENLSGIQDSLIESVTAQGVLLNNINDASVENFAVLEAKQDAMIEAYATNNAELVEQIVSKQEEVLQQLLGKSDTVNNDIAQRQELIVATLTEMMGLLSNTDASDLSNNSDILEIKEVQTQLLQSVLEVQDTILNSKEVANGESVNQVLEKQNVILESLNNLNDAFATGAFRDDDSLGDIAQKQDQIIVDINDKHDIAMRAIGEVRDALNALSGISANAGDADFAAINEKQDQIIDTIVASQAEILSRLGNIDAVAESNNSDELIDISAKQDVIIDTLAQAQVEILEQISSQDGALKEIAQRHEQIVNDINQRLSLLQNDNGSLIADISEKLSNLHEKYGADKEMRDIDNDQTVAWQDMVLAEIAALRDIVELKTIETPRPLIADAGVTIDSLVASDLNGQIQALSNGNQQLLSKFDELKLKLDELEINQTINNGSYDIESIVSKLNGVEEYLSQGLGAVTEKLMDDLSYVREQIEASSADVGSIEYEQVQSVPKTFSSDDKAQILNAIEQVKMQLGLPSNDILAELIALRQELNDTKMLQNVDIVGQLEGLRSEIKELKTNPIADNGDNYTQVLSQIEQLKVQSHTILEQIKNNKNMVIATDVAGASGIDSVFGLELSALRDELSAYRAEVGNLSNTRTNTVSTPDLSGISSELRAVTGEIFAEIVSLRQDMLSLQTANNENATLKSELAEIKSMIRSLGLSTNSSVAPPVDTTVYNNLINRMKEEFSQSVGNDISALRADISGLRLGNTVADITTAPEVYSRLDEVRDEIATVYTSIADLANSMGNGIVNTDDIASIKADIAALRDQVVSINALREDLLAGNTGNLQVNIDNSEILARLDSFGAELKMLKDSQTVTDYTELYDRLDEVRGDIAGIFDNLGDINNTATGSVDNTEILSRLDMLGNELRTIKSGQSTTTFDAQFYDKLDQRLDQVRGDIALIFESLGNVGVVPTTDNAEVLDRLDAFGKELRSLGDRQVGSATVDTNLYNRLDEVKADIASIFETLGDVAGLAQTVDNTEVLERLDAFGQELAAIRDSKVETIDSRLDDKLDEVKTEISAIYDSLDTMLNNGSGNKEVLERLEDFANDLAALKENNSDTDNSQLFDILDNIKSDIDARNLEIYERIADVSRELENIRDKAQDYSEINARFGDIKEDITSIYENIAALATLAETQPNSYEPNEAVVAEVNGLKKDLADLKKAILEQSKSVDTMQNDVILDQLEAVYKELRQVRISNEEPDYGVIQEILTLRDEFQAVKIKLGEVQDQQQNSEQTNSAEILLNEIKELRDQLFAISMATVGQGENAGYETYNNIILDEVANLRKQVSDLKDGDIFTDNSEILDQLVALKRQLELIKVSPVDTKQIEDKIDALRKDVSTILKAESANSSVLSEIASIKDVGTQRDNAKIDKDDNLSKSISELKKELNQIADIMGDKESPKSLNEPTDQVAKLKSNVEKAKKNLKKSSKQKVAKPIVPDVEKEIVLVKEAIKNEVKDLNSDELMTLIGNTTIEMMQVASDEQANRVFKTGDLDMASKLAKQVANKLILEQLVSQLSEGGVPRSQIDEVVRDIIPPEYNTIQIDEQTEQVKRLANALVLDKLRNKLKE